MQPCPTPSNARSATEAERAAGTAGAPPEDPEHGRKRTAAAGLQRFARPRARAAAAAANPERGRVVRRGSPRRPCGTRPKSTGDPSPALRHAAEVAPGGAPGEATVESRPMPARILLVEDRESLRRMIAHALESQGHEVTSVADGEAGIAALDDRDFDLLLSDLKLPGCSGLDVLAAARRLRPALPVVVMTAYGTVSAAVEAMKLGAADFLEKPVDLGELERLVGSLAGAATGDGVFTTPAGIEIVGRHPRLRAALRLLERVAPTDSTVLLTGASGTGKELFARAVHELSPRAGGPFVALNCAAIPRELLENELFGHEKGAFTGAHRRQEGRFETARGGTLFLDEIGDLDLAVQSKVLRVLEERTFERVGGGATLKADVRLVAATNQDLATRVEAGLFRRDLYFRLEVFPLELPSLAERASDVPLLAERLLARIAARLGRPAPRLQPDAEALLAAAPWPGNVRQLANLLERGVVVIDRPVWSAADLSVLLGPEVGGEVDAVRDALRRSAGDKKRAAELLGVSYRTLQRRVRELDLEGFPKYRD